MPFQTSFHEGALPAGIGTAMEQLYRSVFSSLSFLQIHGSLAHGVHAYLARERETVRAALLFEIRDGTARVLNETITLLPAEIERFAGDVLAHYPQVHAVSFNAVHVEDVRFSLPFLRSRHSEDIVVTLPATREDYVGRLGHSTRKNIRRYQNKLGRAVPGWRHCVRRGTEISERDVRAIVRLNHARMKARGKRSDYDEEATRRLLALARLHGMVSLVESPEGEILAGEICTEIAGDYYCHVGAHDPRLDDCMLGMLSCYLAICASIARGGREFHLLWGQYPYKYSLLGVQRNLDCLTLYRSRTQLCLNSGNMLRHALDTRVRALKTRVRDRLGRHPLGAQALHGARTLGGYLVKQQASGRGSGQA